MADSSLSDNDYTEKSKDNELIYFASILCETLVELEPLLLSHFPNDFRIKLLMSIKDRWIQQFNQLINRGE